LLDEETQVQSPRGSIKSEGDTQEEEKTQISKHDFGAELNKQMIFSRKRISSF